MQKLSAGKHHNAAIIESGQCFMWGLNRSAQCTRDNSTSDSLESTNAVSNSAFIAEPILVSLYTHTSGGNQELFEQVSCGKSHSIAVAKSSGRVYTWGDASFGKLGIADNAQTLHLNNKKVISQPVEIEFFSQTSRRAAKVCAAAFHSVVLTLHGEVFAFGCNFDAQLGVTPSYTNVFKSPVKVDFSTAVNNANNNAHNNSSNNLLASNFLAKDICCSEFGTMVVTNKGENVISSSLYV